MNNIVNLSICADDFGITKNVSSAIVKLIKKKRITETSCIVISDSFKNDSKTLINFQNQINFFYKKNWYFLLSQPCQLQELGRYQIY